MMIVQSLFCDVYNVVIDVTCERLCVRCRWWSCSRNTLILLISMRQCIAFRSLMCHISIMNLSIRFTRYCTY